MSILNYANNDNLTVSHNVLCHQEVKLLDLSLGIVILSIECLKHCFKMRRAWAGLPYEQYELHVKDVISGHTSWLLRN